ncbi:MAG: GLUG motif-containing protein [Planctomycetota bacterium]|jgi:hypothetical protein
MYRIAFIISLVVISAHTALGISGSGTEAEPWRIESLGDFDEFAADANYWVGYIRLETDVNLAGRTYSTAVIAPDTDNSDDKFYGPVFGGIFDGNDHKIVNLTINGGGTGNDFVGLFGSRGYGETKNLGLEACSVSGELFVGGLVGIIFGGRISNCYFTGSVNGVNYVGGLVGDNNSGSVTNCYSTGDVNGTGGYIGGLVGGIYQGSVSNCYSACYVSGIDDVGGLVGNSVGSIVNCYSTGDVIGTGDYDHVGGLVGFHDGVLSNCYSTGDVSGDDYVGGLVGYNFPFSIVSDCFWDTDTQTHGVTDSIGYNKGTAINIAGLPTSEIQTKSTFTDAGWDFIEIWDIGERQTYPYLRAYLSADSNHDGRVNMVDFAILAGHWLEGAGG